MKKVVFLDRDGVLNRERGEYTYKANDFKWVEDAIEALEILYSKGFELIVISNQGGISKGIYSKSDVFEIESQIVNPLKNKGFNIIDSFYCPHHSSIENCLCRKPKSLMLEKAVAKHNVDVTKSFFIGDSERDIIAGEQIGIKGILMRSNDSLLLSIQEIIYE